MSKKMGTKKTEYYTS